MICRFQNASTWHSLNVTANSVSNGLTVQPKLECAEALANHLPNPSLAIQNVGGGILDGPVSGSEAAKYHIGISKDGDKVELGH